MVELGNKHECLGCGTKFYDLGKNQTVCPKCGADQDELAKEALAAEELEKEKKRRAVKAKAKSLDDPVDNKEVVEDDAGGGDESELDNEPESDDGDEDEDD
jgi:uncharacterized protein (TIGR02300 family)